MNKAKQLREELDHSRGQVARLEAAAEESSTKVDELNAQIDSLQQTKDVSVSLTEFYSISPP